jgi:AcrR family transcriptional regulator
MNIGSMPKVVPEYKENAKRRILEAAMDVIAERGCDRMTIDDVAKKLGVTKGAVYWYFPNKEELLTAVLKEVLSSIQAEIRKCTFESYYNKTAEETMIQIFDRFVLAYSEKRELFFEMFSLANRDSDARRAIREYYDGVTATFEKPSKKRRRGTTS